MPPRGDDYDPFEDDGTGYITSRPGFTLGSALATQPYPWAMTEDEMDADAASVEAAVARRIPLGFRLPEEGA